MKHLCNPPFLVVSHTETYSGKFRLKRNLLKTFGKLIELKGRLEEQVTKMLGDRVCMGPHCANLANKR